MKLDTKNSSETGVACVIFLQDNYILDDISETMCVKLGTQPRILIDDCKDRQQIPFQYGQLTGGMIFCTITKTGDTVRFDFDVLGSLEIKLIGSCNVDTVWLLFIRTLSRNGIRNWVLYYKSVMAGQKLY
jgi:hypothetical protein